MMEIFVEQLPLKSRALNFRLPLFKYHPKEHFHHHDRVSEPINHARTEQKGYLYTGMNY